MHSFSAGFGLLAAVYASLSQCQFSSAYTGARMGSGNNECDDGSQHPSLDWDGSFYPFTCPSFQKWLPQDINPYYFAIPDLNPLKDEVRHFCLNTSISYNSTPPLRGDHRPKWPKYGEYLYVPPQRWLHNLEHGAIVMLYHPCANEQQVSKLRTLVIQCLSRYIITPYSSLTEERPLALVAWGAKLELNTVDEQSVLNFIKARAKHAPEDTSKAGQYDLYLIKEAEQVFDLDDSILCPTLH